MEEETPSVCTHKWNLIKKIKDLTDNPKLGTSQLEILVDTILIVQYIHTCIYIIINIILLKLKAIQEN